MNEQQFSELISEATGGAVQPKPVLRESESCGYFTVLQLLFKLLHTVSDHDQRLFLAGWKHKPGTSVFILEIRYLPELMTPDLYIIADWGILANVPDETKFYWELDQ